jgi:hypothetical protein
MRNRSNRRCINKGSERGSRGIRGWTSRYYFISIDEYVKNYLMFYLKKYISMRTIILNETIFLQGRTTSFDLTPTLIHKIVRSICSQDQGLVSMK